MPEQKVTSLDPLFADSVSLIHNGQAGRPRTGGSAPQFLQAVRLWEKRVAHKSVTKTNPLTVQITSKRQRGTGAGETVPALTLGVIRPPQVTG